MAWFNAWKEHTGTAASFSFRSDCGTTFAMYGSVAPQDMSALHCVMHTHLLVHLGVGHAVILFWDTMLVTY
jgi:hypothetical protein